MKEIGVSNHACVGMSSVSNEGGGNEALEVRWDEAIHDWETRVEGGGDGGEGGGRKGNKLGVFVKEELSESRFEGVVRRGKEEDCGDSRGGSEDDTVHCSLEGREEAAVQVFGKGAVYRNSRAGGDPCGAAECDEGMGEWDGN